MKLYTCKQCGINFPPKIPSHIYKFCSHKCLAVSQRGKPTKRFEKIDRKGYWYIHLPHHPNVVKQGYFAEHRYVMEQHIKRLLNPEERVHHINHDKKDNRIENLKLFNNDSEHTKHGHSGIGRNTRFKRGIIPWNKGTKGICKPNSGSFKKGNKPPYYNQITYICKECKKEFKANAKRKRNFCNHSCYWKSKKGKTPSNFKNTS